MTVSLDNRLKTAAELCRKGKIICDVGCDHALLACRLAENAREVIASDVADGPLMSAMRTVEALGVKNVRVVKSDGLEKIDFADDVVICGMGGELIASIIGGCRFLSEDTRFVLQPMTRADFLRRWLYDNGFEIIEERSAHVGCRVYTVMSARFTGKIAQVTDLFSLTGKNTDPEYLKGVAAALRKKAHGMEQSENERDKAARFGQLCAEVERLCERLNERT